MSGEALGFYLRQFGGYLTQTNPAGRGYAAFVKAFRSPAGIGVWKETFGNEELLGAVAAAPFSLASNVVYRVRFRVTQASASQTRLQAKVWLGSGTEPFAWNVDRLDDTAELQGTSGGLVFDAWSSLTTGTASDLFVDDLVVGPAT